MGYRIGVDIGGTFTDFALFDDSDGSMAIHKQLTTPKDPSLSVVEGCWTLLNNHDLAFENVDAIVHGTTLVTNAVIERSGAVTGMLVTKGFKDVLDIALERRYDLFDLRLRFPDPLVPRRMRAEIDERMRYDGTIERPLDIAATVQAVQRLVDEHNIKAL